MLVNKYEYKSYKSITEDSGTRQYIVEGQSVPSVTTILSATKSKHSEKALDDWRNRIGDDEANHIVKEAVDIGTTLHHNLEMHMLHGSNAILSGPPLVKMMTKVVIAKGLCNIDEVWGLESNLYCKGLYAGTADVICVHKGLPCIADFKNTRKPKKLEWLDDYRCQLAAYSLAHNEMFGTNIKKGVIMMISRDCTYQEFIIDGKLFNESVTWWLTRLETYLNNN